MKTNSILIASLLFITANCYSQASNTNELGLLVEKTKKSSIPFMPAELFSYKNAGMVTGKGDYHELTLNSNEANSLLLNEPAAIQLKIPTGRNDFIVAELVKVNMGNTRIKTNNKQYETNISKPLLYRGVIRNYSSISTVTFTINKNFTSFTASLSDKNYYINTTRKNDEVNYYLYNTAEINLPGKQFSCGSRDPSKYDPASMPATEKSILAASDKCVYVFVDATNKYFKVEQYETNPLQNTIDKIFGLFNDVGAAYRNEQINIKISEINVWTQEDPFNHNNRDTALHDFAFYYQDNYWGNLAVQLDWSTNISGIAAYIGKVKGELPNNCPGFNPNPQSPGEWWGGGPLCYNDLNYGGIYSNFPVPGIANQVYLITHEMGHLLGSAHTHWCGWNLGNNTFGALDNCAATEGGCAMGPAPVNGGTFMSYCNGTGQFINYNNGFGQKPGDMIRNFVSSNSCINNCPSCPADIPVGNLGAGPNHLEVSNTISANGILPAGSFSVFDAGNKVTLSPGFKATEGSTLIIINNGCGGIQ